MFEMRDDDVIWWAGWETTWKKLQSSGWFICVKPAYYNRRLPHDSVASKEKVYIRHRASKMLGKLIPNAISIQDGYYELDFLTLERNKRVKSKPFIMESDLTADDIPALMQLILTLQETVKPKRRASVSATHQAEILLLRDSA